jgi:TolB-like protein
VVVVAAIWAFRGTGTGPARQHRAPAGGPGAAAPAVAPAQPARAPGPILVTFFTNHTGDPAIDGLCRVIPEMLTTDLARTPSLEVVSTQRLYDLLAEAGQGDPSRLDRTATAELARWAGAGLAVSGSVFGSADRLRIDVQAYDTETGQVIAAHRVEGTDELQMVDELSVGLRRGLQVPEEKGLAGLRASLTASPEALQVFGEGRKAYESLRFDEAAESFRRAVETDPGFDLARLRLGMSLYLGGDTEEGAETIRALDAEGARLPEPRRMLLVGLRSLVEGEDAEVVVAHFDALSERHPRDAEAAYWKAVSVARLDSDRVGALKILRGQLAANPEQPMVVAAMAGHLEALGLRDEAEALRRSLPTPKQP